ncbi:MAG: methyltransferase family protein [Acidithiobacillus ferrivorans]
MSYQMNSGSVRRFAKIMKFGAWLQAIPNKLTPPPFRLMQIGSAFWQSRALYVATRLDIATVLGDEALDAGVIAVRVAANADATGRLAVACCDRGLLGDCAASVPEQQNIRLPAHRPSELRIPGHRGHPFRLIVGSDSD